MEQLVKVEFSNKKTTLCKKEQFNLKKNLTVIVKTDRGLEFGTIIDLNIPIETSNDDKIIRIATKQDYYKHLKNKKDEQEAVLKCKSLSKKHNLNIEILDANFTLDRSQLMFRFISDSRVDFRMLAKDLAYIYKARIELRQIGIRDKAKEIGGLGQCGRELCCKGFLKNLNSVSIGMAKNQDISLNPSKINGSCGRLLCCLNYENENYKICRQGLPNVGDIIEYNDLSGTVISVNILERKYKLETKTGVIEVCLDGSSK